MIREELAFKLNGVEYRNELSDELDNEAKENGLLIIYGGSDDLLYLGGVGNDEIGCWNGGDLIISKDGDGYMLDEIQDLEGEDEKRLAKFRKDFKKGNIIKVKWCEDEGYSWTYDSKIPYSTFDVIEDGEKFCRGIVLSLKDLF